MFILHPCGNSGRGIQIQGGHRCAVVWKGVVAAFPVGEDVPTTCTASLMSQARLPIPPELPKSVNA